MPPPYFSTLLPLMLALLATASASALPRERQIIPAGYAGSSGSPLNGTAFEDGYVSGAGFWIFIAVFPALAVVAVVVTLIIYAANCGSKREVEEKDKAEEAATECAIPDGEHDDGDADGQPHVVVWLGGEQIATVPALDQFSWTAQKNQWEDPGAEVGAEEASEKASSRRVRFEEHAE